MQGVDKKILTEQQVRKLLKPFRDEELSRFGHVFYEDRHVCATDGRKLIRLSSYYCAFDVRIFAPSPFRFGKTANEIIQNAEGIDLEKHAIDLEKHPELDPADDPTYHCSCESGFVPGMREFCGLCKGCGHHECESCHQETDCENCCGNGGWGGEPCPYCHGDDPRVLFMLGNSSVARSQLEPITNLPGMRIAFPETNSEPIYFVWDYGDGCVMPIGRM